jgi:hypothetical protein
LTDEHWNVATKKELQQFKRNDVWEPVSKPKDVNTISTNWVFCNETNELGNITRNKVGLVAQGYTYRIRDF